MDTENGPRVFVIKYLPEDLYWRPNYRGYTRQIIEAGVYTEETLKRACLRSEKDRVVPLDEELKRFEVTDAVIRAIVGEAP